MDFFTKIGIGVILSPILLLIVYIISIYSYLSFGYVITITWDWFIPVELTSFKPEYWQSVGLYFIVKLFLNGVHNKKSSYLKDEMYETSNYNIGSMFSILTPWILLLIGYMVHKHFFFW